MSGIELALAGLGAAATIVPAAIAATTQPEAVEAPGLDDVNEERRRELLRARRRARSGRADTILSGESLLGQDPEATFGKTILGG